MKNFTISLAGVTIAVSAIFNTSRSFCEGWLSDETPEVKIEITEQDIIAERLRSRKQLELEGKAPYEFADAYLETLAIYRKIAESLFNRGIMLFHGCVIAYEGKAYIFTAKSGTGKTTHARLWLENIPGCHILNGDKPLLIFKDDGLIACGTPWRGKENMGINEMLPVRGICLLERGESNHIERLSFGDVYTALLSQFNIPECASMLDIILLLKKMENVPVYRLSCNMEREAARVSFEMLTGQQRG